jgi:hypothetical protein
MMMRSSCYSLVQWLNDRSISENYDAAARVTAAPTPTESNATSGREVLEWKLASSAQWIRTVAAVEEGKNMQRTLKRVMPSSAKGGKTYCMHDICAIDCTFRLC